jgi:hypothetical protein
LHWYFVWEASYTYFKVLFWAIGRVTLIFCLFHFVYFGKHWAAWNE